MKLDQEGQRQVCVTGCPCDRGRVCDHGFQSEQLSHPVLTSQQKTGMTDRGWRKEEIPLMKNHVYT